MDGRTLLLELLLGGFFAVACVKSWGPSVPEGKLGFGDLMRFPDRIERLRRSRWQWFSMVALLLILRLQHQLPLILEVTVLLQFIMFTAMPAFKPAGSAGRIKGNAAVTGRH